MSEEFENFVKYFIREWLIVLILTGILYFIFGKYGAGAFLIGSCVGIGMKNLA